LAIGISAKAMGSGGSIWRAVVQAEHVQVWSCSIHKSSEISSVGRHVQQSIVADVVGDVGEGEKEARRSGIDRITDCGVDRRNEDSNSSCTTGSCRGFDFEGTSSIFLEASGYTNIDGSIDCPFEICLSCLIQCEGVSCLHSTVRGVVVITQELATWAIQISGIARKRVGHEEVEGCATRIIDIGKNKSDLPGVGNIELVIFDGIVVVLRARHWQGSSYFSSITRNRSDSECQGGADAK